MDGWLITMHVLLMMVNNPCHLISGVSICISHDACSLLISTVNAAYRIPLQHPARLLKVCTVNPIHHPSMRMNCATVIIHQYIMDFPTVHNHQSSSWMCVNRTEHLHSTPPFWRTCLAPPPHWRTAIGRTSRSTAAALPLPSWYRTMRRRASIIVWMWVT